MRKDDRNINDIVQSGLCLHCGTCLNACPRNSIEAKLDENGDWIPWANNDCNNCSICIKVCPGINADMPIYRQNGNEYDEKLGSFKSTYIARAQPSILSNRRVASGGVVSAIARTFLEEHPTGLVQWTTISKDTKFRPHSDLLDIESFNKVEGDSIYIPSFANVAFRGMPKGKRPILAIGLPCQIRGLILLMELCPQLKEQVVCMISLFCGLSVSISGIEYLIKASGHDISEIAEIRFRNKKRGLLITLTDGNSVFLNKNYINLSHMCRRCALCSDHTGELADIACGDAWMPFFTKKTELSWSVVIARSGRGISMIRHSVLNKNLWAMRTDPENIIESQKPMLYFKKSTLSKRLLLNRAMGGVNPRFCGLNITENASPRALMGNLLLLICHRLSPFKFYRKSRIQTALLKLFNKSIMISLYSPSLRDPLVASFKGLFMNIMSVSVVQALHGALIKTKRALENHIPQSTISHTAFVFCEHHIVNWHHKFPEASKELLSQAKIGKVDIYNKEYNLAEHGWNKNPSTYKSYPNLPISLMGSSVNSYEIYGDGKDFVEVHKHYGFFDLALAYRITNEIEFLEILESYIVTWRKAYLPNCGIGWWGNINVAQRMVIWIFVYMLLGDQGSKKAVGICEDILNGLREHESVLKGRFRNPPNNHKIGALTALIIYRLIKGNDNKNSKLDFYMRELVDTVLNLVTAEGAPIEGSPAYGRLVLEFLLLLKIVSDSSKYHLPSILLQRIEAIVDWNGKFLGPENTFPPIGDDSGERAFPFNDYLYDPADTLLIGQALFSRPLSREPGPLASLLLKSIRKDPQIKIENPPKLSSFVDSNTGYGRISFSAGSDQWTIWMRAGHFGFPPSYAHAHSDFLAPIISLNGCRVLTESGTFRYNIFTEERLKDVLSEGHSGIRYEIIEQGDWKGTFKWGSPLPAQLREIENGIEAWVTMKDKSRLRRKIVINNDGIEIFDNLENVPDEERLIEWYFIVDGVLKDVLENGSSEVGFQLREMNLTLYISRESGCGNYWEVSPCRIATGYGVSNEGTRFIVRSLLLGENEWSTRLWVK